ncbi:MAG: M43 family zinc metalloprotease [Chitinophagales bacterium]|nr:M43 family zinc metalloprotease [Chitinophagales bacterium]
MSNLSHATRCGTDIIHNRMMLENNDYRKKMQAFEELVQSSESSIYSKSASTIVIPVVVHVMSTGNHLTDISVEQIQEAIKVLNQRYRKVPGSIGDGNGVDIGIEFALAVRDPNGNCTNGITYTNMSSNTAYMNNGVRLEGNVGITDLQLKNTIRWNPNLYYNLWLVSEIDNNEGGLGILGYAYFASSHGSNLDGAVMLVNTVKNTRSNTLAHELGHAFNLYHTFEGDGNGSSCPANGNCSTQGDRVCDTPPHKMDDCSSTTCSSSPDINNSLNNYMSYCSDANTTLFTQGQKDRVISAMNTTRKSFLASQGNLSLTPPAIAQADFYSPSSSACLGNSVQFFDNSSCIPNTMLADGEWSNISFQWTLTNGIETLNSTLQNPVFTFNSPGSYDVTLQVTNAFGTHARTVNDYIYVANSPISACIPSTNNIGNYGRCVSQVKFNTINNATGVYSNEGYTDYSCSLSTIVKPGLTYPIQISMMSYGTNIEQCEVYIDYNNNGNFESNELVFSGVGTANKTATISGNVTIPTSGAMTNRVLRMRVIGDAQAITAGKRSCSSNFLIGDVEDYGIYILADDCPTVTTPTFTQIQPICQGENINLPAYSNEQISGTWSPAVNTNATTTYTFTPNAGQCANSATMTVTVNSKTTPTFTQIQPICQGENINLPAYSNEQISGTWSPAVNANATTTYTFTPNAGQCANSATMTVTVNGKITPTFTQIQPICQGENINLPTNSNEQISGTWSPEVNSNATTTYTFTPNAGQCANTATMTVTVNGKTTPTFTQLQPICQGENINLLTYSNEQVSGTWSPAVNSNATTTYTFTPNAGQCANSTTMTVTVNGKITPTFTQIQPICQGENINLPTYSNEQILGTWSPAVNSNATTTYTFTPNAGQCANTATMTVTVNGKTTPTFTQIQPICQGENINLPTYSNEQISGTWSPAVNSNATTTYTFTPNAGQCANSATMTVIVNSKTTPTFTQIQPICQGENINLPTYSNEQISGTWSPAVNSNATTTYTFTPNAGQCANSATMTVTVNSKTTPTFTQIQPICQGENINLPTYSNEQISGTWSPAVNSNATTTYTFTPNAGQCANSTTMTVTVNGKTIPTFTQIQPICQGENINLPTYSNEQISGTWSPAVNTNATTTYTFTPNAGQCANTATMTVTVNSKTTPTFTQIQPICQGENINLPTYSNEQISGTWSPAVNSNATTTYTFTPNAGQCANSTTMTVTVNGKITPTFTQIQPICQGENINLPTYSNEQISGTWSPAVNTNATTTYTFTPNAGQCANTATMTVIVNGKTTPTFTQIQPVCQGENINLPTYSNEQISGTWSPAVNSNATTTYIFTPNAGQCANSATMTVTVNSKTTPTFTQIQPICQGENINLPTYSNEQISGTWSPAVNSNATTTYTFTPNAGQCANSATMTVTVNSKTTPTFTQIQPICQGENINLPTYSNEQISGTWSPVVNTNATTTYTFTPNAGQCANSATMTVTVNRIVIDTIISIDSNSLIVNEQNATYIWIDCENNQVIDGVTTSGYSPEKNGHYKVIITSTICPQVSFTSECIPFIATGLEDINFSAILIYPNPSSNYIKIENTEGLGVQNLLLRDINGRVLQKFDHHSNYNINIHLDNYSQGVYLLEFITKNGNYIKRVVKL